MWWEDGELTPLVESTLQPLLQIAFRSSKKNVRDWLSLHRLTGFAAFVELSFQLFFMNSLQCLKGTWILSYHDISEERQLF